MQHNNVRCVNLLSRSRRTWKTNRIIPSYFMLAHNIHVLKQFAAEYNSPAGAQNWHETVWCNCGYVIVNALQSCAWIILFHSPLSTSKISPHPLCLFYTLKTLENDNLAKTRALLKNVHLRNLRLVWSSTIFHHPNAWGCFEDFDNIVLLKRVDCGDLPHFVLADRMLNVIRMLSQTS